MEPEGVEPSELALQSPLAVPSTVYPAVRVPWAGQANPCAYRHVPGAGKLPPSLNSHHKRYS
ncbi:hypothetical protein LC593_10790 [Nostoc sp. CHAB 5844]|nr:hypothetical protein [Nostoc sp. CHAB 5844]